MKSNKSTLESRMKGYEYVTRSYLMRKVPVIIRVDGQSFSSFTRGFYRPYDLILKEAMCKTMLEMANSIQGCVFAYTQSDEISFVLTDYDTPTTDAWFGYNVQKMASISASLATCSFNRIFSEILGSKKIEAIGLCNTPEYNSMHLQGIETDDKYKRRCGTASFDARVFSLPKEEVVNYLIWRQKDAIRNSVCSTARMFYSTKQLIGIKIDDAIEMMEKNQGFDWYRTIPICCQRGICAVKKEIKITKGETCVTRRKFTLDLNIPLFTENRAYVNECL